MSEMILKNSKVALEPEVTEGLLVLPSAAGSFISVQEDSVNELLTPAKEALERTGLTASMDKAASINGMKSVTGSTKVEYKAGESAAAPEYGIMVQSALGATSVASNAHTTTTGNTTSILYLASTTGLAAGDIVLVKESGKYHVSPIASVTTDTSITLLVAAATAFSDAVVVDKILDYRCASTGHQSYSLTKYSEDSERVTGAGLKTTTLALENWTTGQMPMLSISYEGMSYTVTTNAPAYTPDIDDSKPVVALSACVYKDGVAMGVNEFTFSLENTLAWKTTTCSANGRIGSRVSGRKLTGTVNPYKATGDISPFTAWENNTAFSLFAWAGNPTSTAGEYNEIVAVYMPALQATEVVQADQDGMLQNKITFNGIKHATLPFMVMAYK